MKPSVAGGAAVRLLAAGAAERAVVGRLGPLAVLGARSRTATSELLSLPALPTAIAVPLATQTSRKRWVPGPPSAGVLALTCLAVGDATTMGSASTVRRRRADGDEAVAERGDGVERAGARAARGFHASPVAGRP